MDTDTKIELKRVLLKTCSRELAEQIVLNAGCFYNYLFVLYFQPFEAHRIKQKQTFVIQATRRYILDRLTSCIKSKKVATDEMEFIINPRAPKFKKIYQLKPKVKFATPLKAHINTVLELMSEVYDYSTFETSFAKHFNISKRTLLSQVTITKYLTLLRELLGYIIASS